VFAASFPNDTAVLARKKAKDAAPPYPPAEMERRLLATITVPPDDLRLLATERGKRCLDYLLSTPAQKIEPERVFLAAADAKTSGARVIFTLQ